MRETIASWIATFAMVAFWVVFGKFAANYVFPELMASEFGKSVPYVMATGVVTGLISFLWAAGWFCLLKGKD